MFEYVQGTLKHIDSDYVVIDINVIGFKVFTRVNSIVGHIDKEEELKLYNYLNVRENEISLYGFVTKQELELFELLINVSGIGPRVALNILNNTNARDLVSAIAFEDVKALMKLPGVGKKTAQKILLELKDKLAISDVEDDIPSRQIGSENNALSEAIMALESLGYDSMESSRAVNKAASKDSNLSVEDLIKTALKELARF
ncbi:MAG: Holliday junction branch migration protein RuvA [Clostridia bacterium]